MNIELRTILELLKPILVPLLVFIVFFIQIYQNSKITKIQSMISQMNQEKLELERENEYIKTSILTQTSQEKIDFILSGQVEFKKVIPRNKIVYLKLHDPLE